MAFNITGFSNKWATFKEELKDYFNNRVVDKNGDTMQGSLVLFKDPTEDMEAATRIYVENAISDIMTLKPGDLQSLSFGTAYYPQHTADVVSIGNTITSQSEFNYCPCANGKVKAIITLNSLNSDGDFLSASFTSDTYNGSRTLRMDSVVSSTTSYVRGGMEFSMSVYLIPDGETKILIHEELNSSAPECFENTNSIFEANAKQIEIEVPVKAGVKPKIEASLIVHSCTSYDGSFNIFKSLYSSGLTGPSVQFVGKIANHTLDIMGA